MDRVLLIDAGAMQSAAPEMPVKRNAQVSLQIRWIQEVKLKNLFLYPKFFSDINERRGMISAMMWKMKQRAIAAKPESVYQASAFIFYNSHF